MTGLSHVRISISKTPRPLGTWPKLPAICASKKIGRKPEQERVPSEESNEKSTLPARV